MKNNLASKLKCFSVYVTFHRNENKTFTSANVLMSLVAHKKFYLSKWIDQWTFLEADVIRDDKKKIANYVRF